MLKSGAAVQRKKRGVIEGGLANPCFQQQLRGIASRCSSRSITVRTAFGGLSDSLRTRAVSATLDNESHLATPRRDGFGARTAAGKRRDH